MMCVYIIAQPFSGMALVKGGPPLLGTLFGGIACMILLLALHNTPLLHLLALALRLGTCLALSLLERSAYSYAFMLSGYTALFISLPYVQSPESIFTVVLTWVEEIALGIFCYMLIDLTVFPRQSHGVYQAAINRFNQLGTQWLQAMATDSGVRQLALRQQLLQALRQCDELREQALRIPTACAVTRHCCWSCKASSNSSSRCWSRWKSDSCTGISHALRPCRPNCSAQSRSTSRRSAIGAGGR